MATFAGAGIQVLVDLSTPGYTLNHSQWDKAIYDHYTSIIDTMQGYKNTLGFLIGDDIDGPANETSAYIRAAVRDMKAYMVQKAYRMIPVGYAATYIRGYSSSGSPFPPLYLDCGDQAHSEGSAIDFLGINDHDWCKGDYLETSYYIDLISQFTNYADIYHYPVPAFFTEYGCSNPANEDFSEISSIYGPNMRSVFSGGLFYTYFGVQNSPYGQSIIEHHRKYGG